MWLQRRSKIILGEDDVLGNSTNAVGTVADGAELRSRDSTSIASNTACIAHAIWIPELLGWCEVQRREGARLSQQVTSLKLVKIVRYSDQECTHGLGIGASSSKALTTGAKAGTDGEYARLSPNGLSDRPATRSR